MREASVKHVDEYMATVQDRLRTALQESQAQLMAEDKNGTMTRK